MIIRALELEAKLHQDLKAANGEIDLVTRQEAILGDAARDMSIGSSLSLDSLREYLSRVRLPATTLLRDYLCTYVQDMHVDQQRIALHVIPLGSLINTDLVQGIIDERRWRATRLDEMASTDWVDPVVARGLQLQASALRTEANGLQRLLSGLMWYLGDSSIYARTQSMRQQLQRSRQALNSVRVSVVGGKLSFDMDGIDLSWAPKQDDDYWKARNRQSLERYLVLDENGHVIGLRPEMADRYQDLLALALTCVFSSGMPEEIDELTDDEKYVVLWLLSTIGPTVLEMETELTSGANKASKLITGKGLTERGIELYGALEDTPLAKLLDPLVTGGLSFTSDGNIFYSVDSPHSVQARNGFADVTELGGALLGMDLDTTVTTFVYDGYEYRLQTWDGTYGSGSAFGGEIGLYRRKLAEGETSNYSFMGADEIRENIDTLSRDQVRSVFTTYETVPDSDQPDMRVVVHSRGDVDIENSVDSTYWSFNADDIPLGDNGDARPGYEKRDTYVEGSLDFSNNPGLKEAMERALSNEDPSKGITVSSDADVLHIEWKR